MIITSHLHDLEWRLGDTHFLRPDYGHYCFSEIPGLIKTLFGLCEADAHPFAPQIVKKLRSGWKHVVVLLIDGFGYRSWMKYADQYPFLRAVKQRGTLLPITALFPSTTSASLTTLNSGLTPQEHGLIEFTMYMDSVKGRLAQTLPFVFYPRSVYAGELLHHGVSPKELFDGVSLYRQLADHGIDGYAFLKHSEAHSAFSSVVMEDAHIVPYYHASDMVVSLREAIAAAKRPSYFYVYWAGIDELSHAFGPHSLQVRAEIRSLTDILKCELLDRMPPRTAKEVALLVTADHGHVPTSAERMTYLNDIPGAVELLASHPDGTPLGVWGSPRDVFLKSKEGCLDEMVGLLSEHLRDKATVLRSQEEANKGLFGTGPEHPKLRSRIGDVLILPHEGETVNYQHPGFSRKCKRGMHGGMSREEMLTIIGSALLSDLQ